MGAPAVVAHHRRLETRLRRPPGLGPAGEFRTGASDVRLAALRVEGVPEPVTFWMSRDRFARWRHTHLTVDVVPGRGGGFSLEAPEGMRFLVRSRLLAPEEAAELTEVE